MVAVYVDASATGGGDTGVDKANAFLTVQQGLDSPAGDYVLMATTHQESTAGNVAFSSTTGTVQSQKVVLLFDFGTDQYAPTDGLSYNIRSEGSGNVQMDSPIIWYGVYFDIGLRLISSGSNSGKIIDGYAILRHGSASYVSWGTGNNDNVYAFEHTDIVFTGAAQFISNGSSIRDFMIGGSVSGTIHASGLVRLNAFNNDDLGFEDVDFSGLVNTNSGVIFECASSQDSGFLCVLRNCIMFPGWQLTDGIFANQKNQVALSVRTGVAGETFASEIRTLRGRTRSTTATYLTGGFQPESAANPVSMQFILEPIVTQFIPAKSMAIPFYYDGPIGAPITVEVEIIENYTTALTDQDLSTEIHYLANANDVARTVSSTRQILGTATTLPAGFGIGNWVNPPAGSRSAKISNTFTPGEKGYYNLYILASVYEVGKDVYYNPEVSIV